MRKLLTAVLFATALLTVPTAHAEYGWAGFTCGFNSTNDPTGQVIQDPNTQTGDLSAGPWAASNFDAEGNVGTVFSVTIDCAIQIDDDANPSVGGTTRSSTTAGNVGVLVDTITYTAAPGDDVYLCMHVRLEGSKGSLDLYVDADEDDPTTGYVGTAGNQCVLVISFEAVGIQRGSNGEVDKRTRCFWVGIDWVCAPLNRP